jgi:hypothetical protein
MGLRQLLAGFAQIAPYIIQVRYENNYLDNNVRRIYSPTQFVNLQHYFNLLRQSLILRNDIPMGSAYFILNFIRIMI